MRSRREQQKQERQTFGRSETATRYQMRQKLISIGDGFYIKNEDGNNVFKVDSKALRVRDTLCLAVYHPAISPGAGTGFRWHRRLSGFKVG